MNTKNVWNLHLLDRLYIVNHHAKIIEDVPVMSLSVDNRDVIVNGITISGNDAANVKFFIDSFKNKLYFNKEDADAELDVLKFAAKTLIQ